MRSLVRSRSVVRTTSALLAVVGLLGCGGGESDTRNRNDALPEETSSTIYQEAAQQLTCDITWDAGSGQLSYCDDVVTFEARYQAGGLGPNGTQSGDGGTALTIPDGTTNFRVKFWTLTDDENGDPSSELTFTRNESWVTSFTYRAPAKRTCDITWNADTKKVTACAAVTFVQGIALNDAGERINSQEGPGNEAGFGGAEAVTMRVNVWVKNRTRNGNEPHASVDFEYNVTATRTVAYAVSDPENSTTTEETTTTVEETPVSVEDTTTTVEETPVSVEDTTTTVEETPVSVEETTTSLGVRESMAATISVQESPCNVTFTAATRTVTLCESFDRIVAAAFGADGEFNETFEAEGDSFQIPEKILKDNGARFLRIAVAQKMNDLDVATFRGEGIVDIADSSSDSSGTIQVSQSGREALNNSGLDSTLTAEITEAGLFDINISWYAPWGETYTNEGNFAFVTLNGEKYTEFEKVKPPSSWDSGQSLAWRAYFLDGFGIPRLVASGRLAQGGSSEVDFKSPWFDLVTQRMEILTEGGVSPANDPCGQVKPYMITTPVTPAKTNMITLTVSTDCESADSVLGLVVFGPDYEIPVFSQFKSTKYSNRLTATIFLADDVYDISWGDFNEVGTHEFVVNGGGSGGDCTQPRLDVATDGSSATLRNCDPGSHRMRMWAYPYSGEYEEDVRLPFRNNVVDLSMVEWSGYVWIELSIDDIYEPDFLVCLRGCEEAEKPNVDAKASVDMSGFATDGTINVTASCVNNKTPEGEGWNKYYSNGYEDLFISSGQGSFLWESWLPLEENKEVTAQRSMPRTGEMLAISYCSSYWENEEASTETETTGIYKFTIDGPMPNRPSNDDFADAPTIGTDVGTVQFSTVSATNEFGEAGSDFNQSNDPGQFNSVWFKYEPRADQFTDIRIGDYTFSAVARVWRVDESGRTALVDETQVWPSDLYYLNDSERAEYETLSFATTPGGTYYVQVLNQNFDEAVGTATLVINDGEGSTVKVASGSQPFVSNEELARTSPPTTTPTVTTTTVVATSPTVGTDSPSTTVTPNEQRYQTAREIGSTNEQVIVLAPTKDSPATIETREDVRVVQIPVADLYGTVSAASANVNPVRSLTLRAPGQRPVHVRPTDKTVSVPVGTATSDLQIQGTTTDGKSVVTTLTIKKTAPPLVTITDGGGSSSGNSTLYLAVIAAVLLLLGGAFVMRRRRSTPAAE